jgi:phospholipase D1/2
VTVEHPAPALVPGRNCWRVERASRVAVIIDAADYFEALREAMLAAERQILLVGWDFDTRVLIDRRERPGSAPLSLGEYILSLADRRPDPCINILVWNLGLVSLARRGRSLIDALRWRWHPRIQLRTDSYHPLGGSVHHKLVVIDDRLAFCGCIDITTDRWDRCRRSALAGGGRRTAHPRRSRSTTSRSVPRSSGAVPTRCAKTGAHVSC